MKYVASLVIPIYNEASTLDNLFNKLKKTFCDNDIKFIIINDGSNDGSKDWLQNNLKKKFTENNYELINLDKNYGKGYAIREGIKKVEGQYTLFIDSDLEYQPIDLLDMFNIIYKSVDIDVIYGSRNLGSKTQLRRYFLNGIAVKVNTWIFNFLFDQSITDLHTGSKIIKTELLKQLNISTNGFGLEIVISSEIAKRNINIFEYGISYHERSREQGKKITLIDGIKSYYFLFRERFLQNDIETKVSLLYSFAFMGYAGTFFGMGIGKTLVIIMFMFIGLMIALNRKIVPLSVIFLLTYIGSLFSKGNGKIYTTIIFFMIGLYISNKINLYFSKTNKNLINRFLI